MRAQTTSPHELPLCTNMTVCDDFVLPKFPNSTPPPAQAADANLVRVMFIKQYTPSCPGAVCLPARTLSRQR